MQAGDAWGAGDLTMLDEEGNPDVDEDEMHSVASEKADEEGGGWDVSLFLVYVDFCPDNSSTVLTLFCT